MVLVETEFARHFGPNLLVRRPRCCAATNRKLTDWTLDIKFDPSDPREQINIDTANGAAAEAHIGRHHVERLHQYADVLQNKRIRDRAIFP